MKLEKKCIGTKHTLLEFQVGEGDSLCFRVTLFCRFLLKKEKMGHSSLTQLRGNQLDPAVCGIRTDCSWLTSNYRISVIGDVSGQICGLTSMIPGF